MIGEPIICFKKKFDIHRKGVVEEVNKFLSTPQPPASGGHVGCNINNGFKMIIDSFT